MASPDPRLQEIPTAGSPRTGSNRRWWLFALLLAGAIVVIVPFCLFVAALSICTPSAPWFCREATLQDRIVTVGMLLAAGCSIGAAFLAIPTRRLVKVVTALLVATVVTPGLALVMGVDATGCSTGAPAVVIGCEHAASPEMLATLAVAREERAQRTAESTAILTSMFGDQLSVLFASVTTDPIFGSEARTGPSVLRSDLERILDVAASRGWVVTDWSGYTNDGDWVATYDCLDALAAASTQAPQMWAKCTLRGPGGTSANLLVANADRYLSVEPEVAGRG